MKSDNYVTCLKHSLKAVALVGILTMCVFFLKLQSHINWVRNKKICYSYHQRSSLNMGYQASSLNNDLPKNLAVDIHATFKRNFEIKLEYLRNRICKACSKVDQSWAQYIWEGKVFLGALDYWLYHNWKNSSQAWCIDKE